jgi:hypothetical protein
MTDQPLEDREDAEPGQADVPSDEEDDAGEESLPDE